VQGPGDPDVRSGAGPARAGLSPPGPQCDATAAAPRGGFHRRPAPPGKGPGHVWTRSAPHTDRGVRGGPRGRLPGVRRGDLVVPGLSGPGPALGPMGPETGE